MIGSRRLHQRLAWYSLYRDTPRSMVRLGPARIWIYRLRHPDRWPKLKRALWPGIQWDI